MEIACRDHGTKKKNLEEQIEELESQRIITPEMKKWADSLREGGNDAAHREESVVGPEEAENCLGLAETLMEHLYVHPARAKDLLEKFAQNKQKEKQSRHKYHN